MAIQLVTGLNITNNSPVDLKLIQATTATRDAIPSYQRYIGLTVFVTGSNELYRLQGGIANSNWVLLEQSASYSATASYALNSGAGGTTLETGSFYPITSSWSETASFALNAGGGTTLNTGSIYPITSSWAVSSSFATVAVDAIAADFAMLAGDAINATTASYALTAMGADYAVIAGEAINTTTASYSLTASYALNAGGGSGGTSLSTGSIYPITSSWAISSSFAQVAVDAQAADFALLAGEAVTTNTASFALTASLAVSASWAPGGTGTSLTTGSIYPITASWAVSASYSVSASWAPDRMIESGSNYPITASRSDTSLSASYALTSSWALNAINGGTQLTTGSQYPITSSWALNADTSSYFNQLWLSTGSIYPITTSWAINAESASGLQQPFSATVYRAGVISSGRVVNMSGTSFSNSVIYDNGINIGVGAVVNGYNRVYVDGNILATAVTASLFGTADSASVATSASYVTSASWSNTSSFATSASYAPITWVAPAISASAFGSGSFVGTSYAFTNGFANYQTTTYTLTNNDDGRMVSINNSSGVNIVISGSTLGSTFSCTVFQSGSGQITFVTSSNSVLRNRAGHIKMAGQYAMASLMRVVSGDFILSGDTAS